MSKYAVGTVVQSVIVESVKYEFAPRDEHDDCPWRAVDAPAILTLLMGDENNEIRFTDEDISENIEEGELVVIHTQ